MGRPWAIGVVAGSALVAAACGSDGGAAAARTLSVPSDYASIQDAVDEAGPGDLVLIEPGTYREEVTVDRSDITVRGVDRNRVVLDGAGELNDGFEVVASGVAIENLTVTGYRFNGVIVNGADGEYRADGAGGVDGFRVSHVTAYNNGLYGVYAFASHNGEITDSYASGHPDSGFYVGQCKPCNVVLRHITAERNAIGYYGTNASGGVYVVESEFRANRLGIAPNSQDAELLAPQAETFIVGNLVSGVGAEDAPEITQGLFGGGIAIGGGTQNTVVRNRVVDHAAFGIGLVALGPYDPEGNRVEGNVVEHNLIDLLYSPGQTTEAAGNCFVGNTFTSSVPDSIEAAMPCDGAAGQLGGPQPELPAAPPGPAGELPAPPEQPSMADPSVRPAQPSGTPTPPDLDSIQVPVAPAVDPV